MMRVLAKGFGWIAGLAVLALVLVFAVNATDEDLAPETLAALQVPALPAPSERNGYLDHLVLGAPADVPTFATAVRELEAISKATSVTGPAWSPAVQVEPEIPHCQPAKASCIEMAAAQRGLLDLINRHRVFLQRYRTMREKPEYVDLTPPVSPESPRPAYQSLVNGNRLSLFLAAISFNSGDHAAALREVEAEFAFYRRMASGSRTLLSSMIAFSMLDRTALFAADVARRLSTSDKALWARLEVTLRAPTKEELDIVVPMKQERAQHVEWMKTRKYVRLPDSDYEIMKSLGGAEKRPWWDPVAPYLYRPHQSVNLYVKRTNLAYTVADQPPASFASAVESLQVRFAALEPGPVARWLINPVGYSHSYLGWGSSDYFGRAHGHAALQSLVRLQIRLRAQGIRTPEAVAAALAGPLGGEHSDPFTGKPMRFDRAENSIGFDAPARWLSAPARDLRKPGDRVALPL